MLFDSILFVAGIHSNRGIFNIARFRQVRIALYRLGATISIALERTLPRYISINVCRKR